MALVFWHEPVYAITSALQPALETYKVDYLVDKYRAAFESRIEAPR